VYLIRPEFYVVLVTTTIAALKIFDQILLSVLNAYALASAG
jgi:raffinose/stachyose/melibiose transport system permease protein